MIPRYTPKEFKVIWSDKYKYQTWLSIELVVCEMMGSYGFVPKDTASLIAKRLSLLKIYDKEETNNVFSFEPYRLNIDVARIEKIEKTTKHDVIAFLTYIEELVGEESRWLHLGLTSSDILDTAFTLQLTRSILHINNRLRSLIEHFSTRVSEFRDTPIMGRSHGIHAEPITFGVVLAGHLAELKRCQKRLLYALKEISVGKISGAVGTYVHLGPSLEEKVLDAFSLEPETVSTQVIARDRYAMLFSVLALIASAIERFSQNVRHWQRTEVGEAHEGFTKGQKGSSAMPHKKNPILTENLCGLARYVRSIVAPAMENISLWHERDISHSSVERMIAPDATATVAFMLDRCKSVIANLDVNKERMLKNIELTDNRCFSENVLLALVKKGLKRQDAYEIVQTNAIMSINDNINFKDLLKNNNEVMLLLSDDELEKCFDLKFTLRHCNDIIDRVL